MGVEYAATKWRLFIDSFSGSFIPVLHNRNSFSSIPIGHSVQMKETLNIMDHLLSTVTYQEHKWLIRGVLKVLGPVLGIQGGYTKYPCFLHLCDRRDDDQYYVRKEWLLKQGLKPGSCNVQSHPHVESNRILLLSLHMKVGAMKNFVKAIGQWRQRMGSSNWLSCRKSSLVYLTVLK